MGAPRKQALSTPAAGEQTPPAGRPQMSDIARLAGVSVSAVSRALRGKPDIGEETRKRIVELAQSLNYTVNVSAQNLRLKQNNTVAVVVPPMNNLREQLTEPFFISLISSLANTLTDRGYEMLLLRIDADTANFADLYYTGRAIGLIYTGQWLPHDRLNELAMARVPMALWGEQRPRQMYCTVGTDNKHGGKIATEHLFAQGAKRIAIIGDFGTVELENRLAGYRQAHAERGVAADPALLINTKFHTAHIERDMQALIDSGAPFDGVFACSDLAAITVINTLIRNGRAVPDDVLVVGYDDIELASYFRPALSTVRQPMEEAGNVLVESLLAQVAGGRPEPRQLTTELIVRESTRRTA
ncbi:transcriptional regulator, LacI family [Pseudoduganella namucuonensis]|uniref:Transcriptional regulator, LacI family n=2 Tax=Pseudoduganella namucuonensis TaxID=1035707 RepID=A0A1I7IYR8_9BURK|nr:transcriptional regulator, LacI family [Pseudoduganella namucuonensis]